MPAPNSHRRELLKPHRDELLRLAEFDAENADVEAYEETVSLALDNCACYASLVFILELLDHEQPNLHGDSNTDVDPRIDCDKHGGAG